MRRCWCCDDSAGYTDHGRPVCRACLTHRRRRRPDLVPYVVALMLGLLAGVATQCSQQVERLLGG